MTDRPDLDTFLEALPALGVAELLELTAAHRGIDPEHLGAARVAVQAAAGRAHRADDLARLRADVARWATAPSESGRWIGESAQGDLVLADVRRGAAGAIVDVASALLLADALDPDTRDLLSGSWRPIPDAES